MGYFSKRLDIHRDEPSKVETRREREKFHERYEIRVESASSTAVINPAASQQQISIFPEHVIKINSA